MSDTDAPDYQPFPQFLREHRDGGLATDLAEAMAEVAAAVQEHDKPGTVTLEIRFTPAKDGVQLIVGDTLKTKVPKEAHRPSLFFVGKGGLTRRDPRQPELPLGPAAVPARTHDPAVRGQEA